MLVLAVSGASGKMGQAILRLAKEDKQANVAVALDQSRDNFTKLPSDILTAGCETITDLSAMTNAADVLIDFTRPAATLKYLDAAVTAKIALVIGTTGFTVEQEAQIQQAAKQIPIVYAANMSLGVNLLMAASAQLAKSLGHDFDVDIFETHHRFKVDAPSGSAKSIGRAIATARGETDDKFSMQAEGLRPQDGSIRYQSARSGGVVADHRVAFTSLYESIEISHRAITRDVFAEGAIKAAHWLSGKDSGLYTMFDVLGVKL